MTEEFPRHRLPYIPAFRRLQRAAVLCAVLPVLLLHCQGQGLSEADHLGPAPALEVSSARTAPSERVVSGQWLGAYLAYHIDSGDNSQKDSTREWTIEDASDPGRADSFRSFPAGQSIPRFNPLSNTPIWLRLRLRNSSSSDVRVLLELRNASLVELDLYEPGAAGTGFRRQIAGTGRPFQARQIPYRTPIFALSVAPGEHTYYLRIAGYSYKKVPLRMFFTERDFESSAAGYTVLHGLFFGALGVMAIFNALLYFTIRDRSYIYLAFFIFFWALAMFVADGYGRQYFWPGSVWPGDFFGIFNPLATINLLLFLRSFLRTRRHTPWIDRNILPPLIIAYALVAVSYPLQTDYLRVVIGFAIVLPSGFFAAMLAFVMGIIVWRRGNPAGKYHTMAGLVFMIVGELQYLELFDFVDSNLLTENGARIGFLVYITLLTFGTGQRIRQIKASLQKLNARLELEELRLESQALPLTDAGSRRAPTEWTITPRTEALLQKTITRIQEDFRNEISRESLALHLGWNSDNLGRFFKMYTGERVGDFINRLRVETAAELLRDTEDRITEIAFAVGFDSLKTFNRNFARVLYTTPSEFRKISRMAPGARV